MHSIRMLSTVSQALLHRCGPDSAHPWAAVGPDPTIPWAVRAYQHCGPDSARPRAVWGPTPKVPRAVCGADRHRSPSSILACPFPCSGSFSRVSCLPFFVPLRKSNSAFHVHRHVISCHHHHVPKETYHRPAHVFSWTVAGVGKRP